MTGSPWTGSRGSSFLEGWPRSCAQMPAVCRGTCVPVRWLLLLRNGKAQGKLPQLGRGQDHREGVKKEGTSFIWEMVGLTVMSAGPVAMVLPSPAETFTTGRSFLKRLPPPGAPGTRWPHQITLRTAGLPPKPISISECCTPQTTSSETNSAFYKISSAKPGEQNPQNTMRHRPEGLAWPRTWSLRPVHFQRQSLPRLLPLAFFLHLITRQQA